jgi:hypothetical protein
VTLLGAFFVPAALFCVLFWSRGLLPLLIVASVFEAGSVFAGTIGSFVFGVSPFYFVETCIALHLFWSVWNGSRLLPPTGSPVRSIAVLLLAFMTWSVVSSFLMPYLFAGTPVISARDRSDMDIILFNLEPLRWTLSNLGAAGYMVLNVSAVLFAVLVTETAEQAATLGRALRWAVGIVVVVGLVQQLFVAANWNFPYSVFSNNPNADPDTLYEEFNGFVRINSTFSEPMNSGSFLAAATSGLLAAYLHGRKSRYILAIVAAIAVLLVSTSTTGYIATALMFCVLLVYFRPSRGPQPGGHRPSYRGWVTVSAMMLGAAGLSIVFIPSLSEAVLAMTVNKGQGTSLASRVIADQDTIRLLESTYGFGVGLGSTRPSSLVAALASTVGVVGTVIAGVVVYKIIQRFPGRLAPSWLQMSFWCFIGLVVADSIAIPDINRPTLWALLLVVVAQLHVYPTAAEAR